MRRGLRIVRVNNDTPGDSAAAPRKGPAPRGGAGQGVQRQLHGGREFVDSTAGAGVGLLSGPTRRVVQSPTPSRGMMTRGFSPGRTASLGRPPLPPRQGSVRKSARPSPLRPG